MDISEIYGGNYVNAADLQGREVTVVIESFEVREFPTKNRSGQEYMKKKVVIAFQGKQKRLVCNLTNAGAIAFLYGRDPADWVGREIVLYPTQTQFGAGMTDCVRIKPPNGRAALPNGQADAVSSPRGINGGPPRQHVVKELPNARISSFEPLPAAPIKEAAHELPDDDIPF